MGTPAVRATAIYGIESTKARFEAVFLSGTSSVCLVFILGWPSTNKLARFGHKTKHGGLTRYALFTSNLVKPIFLLNRAYWTV